MSNSEIPSYMISLSEIDICTPFFGEDHFEMYVELNHDEELSKLLSVIIFLNLYIFYKGLIHFNKLHETYQSNSFSPLFHDFNCIIDVFCLFFPKLIPFSQPCLSLLLMLIFLELFSNLTIV